MLEGFIYIYYDISQAKGMGVNAILGM